MPQGLVPRIGRVAPHGAISAPAFVIEIPISPASAARLAWKPAIPKWLLCRTPTIATPALRAISTARSMARRAATYPSPLFASRSAVAGRSRTHVIRASGKNPPVAHAPRVAKQLLESLVLSRMPPERGRHDPVGVDAGFLRARAKRPQHIFRESAHRGLAKTLDRDPFVQMVGDGGSPCGFFADTRRTETVLNSRTRNAREGSTEQPCGQGKVPLLSTHSAIAVMSACPPSSWVWDERPEHIEPRRSTSSSEDSYDILCITAPGWDAII